MHPTQWTVFPSACLPVSHTITLASSFHTVWLLLKQVCAQRTHLTVFHSLVFLSHDICVDLPCLQAGMSATHFFVFHTPRFLYKPAVCLSHFYVFACTTNSFLFFTQNYLPFPLTICTPYTPFCLPRHVRTSLQ